MADGRKGPNRPIRPRGGTGGRKRRVVIEGGGGRSAGRQARDRSAAPPQPRQAPAPPPSGPITVESGVTVKDLSQALGVPMGELIKILMEPDLACPQYGIYAGFGLSHRAAISIGTNPHYGGSERRIEPFLLDFEGDLYGKRLVVELWERLRDEAIFDSEEALVEQIGRDVEATKSAERPA